MPPTIACPPAIWSPWPGVPSARSANLARRAAVVGKRLPTMSIDTEIRFRNAADRAAFADDLTAAVIELAARYHHDDGRPHRLVVAAYPKPKEQQSS